MLKPGRILFAIAILGFGVLCLLYVDFINVLQPMPRWLPGYSGLAIVNGPLLIAAGLAMITHRATDKAGIGIAVSFGLWIVLLQIPSAFTNPRRPPPARSARRRASGRAHYPTR